MKVLVIVAVNLCSLPCPVQQTQGALQMLGTLYQDTHNVMPQTMGSVYCAAAKTTRCGLPCLPPWLVGRLVSGRYQWGWSPVCR